MPITLAERASEQSTYVIALTFTDEDGTALVPNALAWSLLNGSGAVVNGRTPTALTPAASVTIVLSGADLVASEGSTRIVLVEGTYDSDLGADLPLKDTVTFYIANLVGVI